MTLCVRRRSRKRGTRGGDEVNCRMWSSIVDVAIVLLIDMYVVLLLLGRHLRYQLVVQLV